MRPPRIALGVIVAATAAAATVGGSLAFATTPAHRAAPHRAAAAPHRAAAVVHPRTAAVKHRLPGGSHQIRHVFVIVLENESEATSFGPSSPAPYLAETLPSEGAFLPNYYSTGHNSNDNYISMVSGQAPNPDNQADCPIFANFPAGALGRYGQEPGDGCVYPTDVKTIADQLDAAGLSWRDYDESMGADPARESATCGHPAVGSPDLTEAATTTDLYAARHNPFVYFHSIIDNAKLCDSHVVNLSLLPGDLAKVSTTRNYTYIVPDLCNDGHDAPCPGTGALAGPGGLAQINTFLQAWVPKITSSPAFRQDGLLLVTFDEAEGDSSSCCGEIPGLSGSLPGDGQPGNGSGGGKIGAVLLSPCIKPGTVSQRPYNHYTMLGSVENIFDLSHLGYAGLPGERYFGSDIFNRQCGPSPPTTRKRGGAFGASHGSRVREGVSWSASTKGGTALAYWQIQLRRGHRWVTVVRHGVRGSYSFTGRVGVTYTLRARTVNLAGQSSAWASSEVRGS
ncbi:MAG: alkaline phosphatase family protein [Solirubrobacteraceae bacterium]